MSFQKIEEYLNQHFQIFSSYKVYFKLLGFEVMLNDQIHFYLESEKTIKLNDDIQFQFDLLMDEFQEQQNKIDFKFRTQVFTLVFFKDEPKKTIRLS